MATLTSKSIASTYTSLLKLEGDTGSTVAGASGNGVQVKTGDNDATALYLNTDRVGIGNASPARVLDVTGDVGISTNCVVGTAVYANQYINLDGTATYFKDNEGAPIMTLLDNGNVGIGATPVATQSAYSFLQLGGTGGLLSQTASTASNSLILTQNVQRDTDSSWEYIVTDEASLYEQNSGSHLFYTAASGSAGADITFKARMVLDTNSRISLSNNDGSSTSTVFGKLAGRDLAGAGNENTFIGDSAGLQNTIGINNIAIGHNAMDDSYDNATTDAENDNNVFIGHNSGGGTWAAASSSTSYSNHDNIGIGTSTLSGAMTGIAGTIAIGTNALTALTSGARNTAIGYQAGSNLTGHDDNTFIGYQAGLDADNPGVGPHRNTYVGSLSGSQLDDGVDNTALGYNAMAGTASNGNSCSLNVAVGKDALKLLTSGDNNVVIGGLAGDAITTTDSCVLIGYNAGTAINHADADGTIAIGQNSGEAITSGARNLSIGYQALKDMSIGDGNTAIGYNAMDATQGTFTDATCDYDHTGVSPRVVAHNVNGNIVANIYVSGTGIPAGAYVATIDSTTQFTLSADTTATAEDGELTFTKEHDDNVAIGSGAMGGVWTGAASSDNLAIGNNTLAGAMAGCNLNVVLGNAAANSMATGSENIFIGSHAGYTTTDVDKAVVIGKGAGYANMTSAADGTVAMGTGAFASLLSGAKNTAIGYLAAADITTGISNTVVGYEALTNAQAAVSYSTAIGSRAGYKLGDDGGSDHSSKNTMVGYAALGGGDNTVANNIAAYNTAIGYRTLGGATIDSDGTAVTTTNCVAIGHDALDSITSGDSCVAVGKDAGGTITTGAFNTLVGTNSDTDAVSDSYQTRIGMNGALRWMTAQVTMDNFNNVSNNDAATSHLLKIPQYGFLKRVTATVVTASGGTGHYNIHLGTAEESPGDSIAGAIELIGDNGVDGTGATTRSSTLDAAGDTNVDLITAKHVHIWECDQATDNAVGWSYFASAPMYLFIGHANGSNANHATNAVIRVTAEYYGEA